jgi:hypothetical protein
MRNAMVFLCLSVLVHADVASRQHDFPRLAGPYLGQKPPGIKPEVFAPGIVSTSAHEFSCCVSPDGKEFYFARRHPDLNWPVIMVSRLSDGAWTEPEIASFVEKQPSFEPWITPDNKRLYFQSGKPIPGQSGPPMNVLYVERGLEGWGTAVNPGSPFNPAKAMHFGSTRDGTIYTTDISQGPGSERIAVSRLVNGKYENLERLGPPISGELQTMHPYIAPDESYIVYSSRKPSEKPSFDLLVSFRKRDGGWDEPKKVDVGMSAGLPFVSPDGKYLFFTGTEPGQSKGPGPGVSDIYWVSARIIEDLRPKESR